MRTTPIFIALVLAAGIPARGQDSGLSFENLKQLDAGLAHWQEAVQRGETLPARVRELRPAAAAELKSKVLMRRLLAVRLLSRL